jgi:hypothetical protein
MKPALAKNRIKEQIDITAHRNKTYTDISSRVFQSKKALAKPTSLELEYIEHCSFSPVTDTKSTILAKGEGKVEDRLIKFNDQKAKKIEEMTKVLSPKFVPNINRKKEFKPSPHTTKGRESKEGEVAMESLNLNEKLKELENYGDPFSMDDVKIMLEYKN